MAQGVQSLLAGESLNAVASIVTTRTAFRPLNADGELVLQIADDDVEAGPSNGESTEDLGRGGSGRRPGVLSSMCGVSIPALPITARV